MDFTRRLAERTYGLAVLGAVLVHDIDSGRRVDWCRSTEATACEYWYSARNEASWRLHRQVFRFFLGVFATSATRCETRVLLKCRLAIYRAAMTASRFYPHPEYPG